jgi:ATP-dependent protease ClpP protease subunit
LKNKKYKGFYNIVKNESKKEATIYIYGVIGGFDWDSYSFINTSDKFVEEFKQVESEADVIHIRINSPGGNVHDGLPIYNTIKNSSKTIYTYVDGIAYSMAALIALAGKKVYGYSNSLFMVHNASTFFFGNAKEIREEAEVLDKYDKSLGSIIEEKLNVSEEDVAEKYLNYKDNYFTGKEAKEEGFFDELNAKKTEGTPENVENMTVKEVFDHYVKMNFSEEPAGEPTPAPKSNQNPDNSGSNNNQNHIDMAGQETTFEQISATLNIEGGLKLSSKILSGKKGAFLDTEQLQTLESALADHDSKLNTVQGKLDTAETNNKALNDALTESLTTASLDAKDTPEASIKMLGEKVKEYGNQPGEKPTSSKTEVDRNDDVDDNSTAIMDQLI